MNTTDNIRSIDLNADLGEGIGDDAAMLAMVSSASIACGAHAGGPDEMSVAFAAALRHHVAVGAHPGYADRAHFGRVAVPRTYVEIERLVADQVALACGLARQAGHEITYVKAHGALYHLAAIDADAARAIARAIRAVDPTLACLCLAGSAGAKATAATGLRVAAEVFADRAYLPDGALVPRGAPGAVILDAAVVTTRALRMLETGTIPAVDGSLRPVQIDSICLHGDTPGAVTLARALHSGLVAAGWRIAPFAP